MPNVPDFFNQEAFDQITMTEALNKIPYQPRRLGALNLFEPTALDTDVVVIDETEGQIQILDTRPRGAAPQRAKTDIKPKARAFQVPHMQFETRLKASEIQGKRRPGTTDLESVAQKLNDKTLWFRNQIETTHEIHRLNALRGVLLDADGSVIFDFFDEFDVAQNAENFEFSNNTFKVREACIDVARRIEEELGDVSYTALHAFCGREFFDELTSHPLVRDTYIQQEAVRLRDDLRTGFTFGGITFEEYRGIRGNAVAEIDDDKAYVIPLGTQGMFRFNYAPGDFMDTVNLAAMPMYMRTAPDTKYNRWVDLLGETNPLFINTRPRAVVELTAT